MHVTLNEVKGVVPRVMMVVVYFLLFYFMCSFYVALEEELQPHFKANMGEGM